MRCKSRRRLAVVLALSLSLIVTACEEGGDSATSGGGGRTFGAQDFGGPAYSPTGTLVADLGYRPEAHGFGFENYGPGFTNLTPVEMTRLFGDEVCANLVGGECELTPPAQQWMEKTNTDMEGGHCYGLSVSSLLFFTNLANLGDFGAASAPELVIQDNDALQRDIAYTWAFQTVGAVSEAQVRGTPSQILDRLTGALTSQPPETYTIGITQRDGGGGHAVTPFAVEDRGDGTVAVLVYDNNFPLITRAILIDRQADTWAYNASTNPSEPESKYEGDASTQSLSLYPTTPGLAQQPCPFCRGGGGGEGAGLGASAPQVNELFLEGNPQDHAHLLITDDTDREYGYVGDEFRTEIPGVESEKLLFVDNYKYEDEPTYQIPVGTAFEVTVDGTELDNPDTTTVGMIGPGYDVIVEEIKMEPGQKDTIIFSPDGRTLSYDTDSSESPIIELGIEEELADYGFAVQGVDMEGGGTIKVTLDPELRTFTLDASDVKQEIGTYGIAMVRLDDQGEQVFAQDALELASGERATLEFGSWDANGETIPLTITGADGVTETLTLVDEG